MLLAKEHVTYHNIIYFDKYSLLKNKRFAKLLKPFMVIDKFLEREEHEIILTYPLEMQHPAWIYIKDYGSRLTQSLDAPKRGH